jgi:hypothetical protein
MYSNHAALWSPLYNERDTISTSVFCYLKTFSFLWTPGSIAAASAKSNGDTNALTNKYALGEVFPSLNSN